MATSRPGSPTVATRTNRVWPGRWLRPAAEWLVVWLAIVVWRFEVIDSPPYWDSAMGLFTEANFLVESGFDYRRLWLQEERFSQGGPAVYLTSVMPTVVALFLNFAPSVRGALIGLHLLNFAAAAALACAVAARMRGSAGTWGAWLVSAALVTTPLVAVQIDMIGMDLPMAWAAMVALGHAAAQRFGRALAWGWVAFLIKQSGGVVTTAILVYLTLLLLFSHGRALQARRHLWWKFWPAAYLSLVVQVWVPEWIGRLPQSEPDRFQADPLFGLKTLGLSRYWCPDLWVLALLVLLGTAELARRWFAADVVLAAAMRPGAFGKLWEVFRRCGAALALNPLGALAWLVLLGTLAALSLLYTIPRYLLLPAGCLWLLAGLLGPALGLGRLAAGACAVWIGLNLANASGRFLPELPHGRRTGAVWERSREYLADHRANQATVEYLVRRQAHRPIVAPSPLVHFLALPRLGYVERPLHGYALHAFQTRDFRPIAEILSDRPADPVFVWIDNSFAATAQCTPPRPGPTDQVLHSDGLEPPAVVFANPELAAALPGDRERWYRRTLLPETLAEEATAQLVAAGRLVEAEVRLRRQLGEDPQNAALRHNLAVVLAKQRQLDEAGRLLEEATRAEPERADSWALLGGVRADQQRFDEAAEALRQATELRPKNAEYLQHLALVLQIRGQPIEAGRAAQQSLGIDPRNPQTALLANNLAWTLATSPADDQRAGSLAVQLAQAALAALGRRAGVLDTLAAALAEMGQFAEAARVAGEAAERAPAEGISAAEIQARQALYERSQPYRDRPSTGP